MTAKISSVSEITKLAAMRDKTVAAIAAIPAFRTAIEKSVDSTAPASFNTGHNMFIQKYTSGSDPKLDLSGCYVGVKIIDGAKAVLEQHKRDIEARLMVLGVQSIPTTIPLNAGNDIFKQRDSAPFIDYPSGGNGGALTYASSNTQVATVNATHGVITIVGEGNTTITVKETDTTNQDTYILTVYPILNFGTLPVFTESSQPVVITGQGGSGEYRFSSDNLEIFTVGVATGTFTVKKKGTAKLSITDAKTNVIKTIDVTIYGDVKIGGNVTRTTTQTTPFTQAATDGSGTYTYASSATNIATVNATSGEVTITGTPGTTTITVTDGITAKTATYTVTVSTP